MTLTQPQLELPGRYRVLRHVASGGMASVYAARDELLGREVAVKVLAAALSADERARRRFTREARAAARLSDHPHVVTIYDIAETAGDPPAAFIVMELLTGGTVADRLRAGASGPAAGGAPTIPRALALRWLHEAALALDAAHRLDVVHRDVKPANLLLDHQETLKVADFGIATLASEAPLTQTGQVVGTAAYLSPEQALGRPATAASDRYALAVVAYELLTGRRPFEGTTPAAQALAHADSEPAPASLVAGELPRAVDAVLARGLAKDPAARPPSAAAFVDELHAALAPTATTRVAAPLGRAGAAAVGGAAAGAALGGAAGADPRRATTPHAREPRWAPPPPAGPPPVRSRQPRSRAGRLAALAALLLVAGAAVAALTGGGDGRLQALPQRRTAPAPSAERPSSAPSTPTTASAPVTSGPASQRATQAQAHALIQQGRYDEAIATLRSLVAGCDVAITDPCAYAWFDLGYALRRAGQPAAAVPVLEHRLTNPNQAATVQAELAAARAEAGQAAPAGKPGKGKGRGHGKGGDGGEGD